MISFKSFLSHRYKSPAINLYFLRVFSQIAEVQFDVDEGVFSTNVSRLQKIIREADAFIGIYPFPGSAEQARNTEELKKQSRYFRLELDMAVRSNKPAIVFYDKRYRELIDPPSGVLTCAFDHDEVTGTGGYPNYAKHTSIFTAFCGVVEQYMACEVSLNRRERTKVALFTMRDINGYEQQLSEVVNSHYFSDLEVFQGPFKLEPKLLKLLGEIDLAIIDYDEQIAASGLPAYMHGRFIPTIRLRLAKDSAELSVLPAEDFLFGGVEVGYQKDVVIWTDIPTLLQGLASNLDQINSSVRRINTAAEAAVYFNSADLHKEAVFVSYSGKDIVIAQQLIYELKKRYQTVFDYRDGESIGPGQPWLTEIFDKLSNSAIGINLFSTSYFASENCKHEALQMVANHDNGQLRLFPLRLYDEPLEIPAFFQTIQYLRYYDFGNDPEKMVSVISKAMFG